MANERTFRILQLLDMLVYGVGLAVLVGGTPAALVLLVTGSPTTAREALFLVGVLLLAVGALLTRPRREELIEDDEDDDVEGEPARVQQELSKVVPGQPPLAPAEQSSLGGRLVTAGLVVQVATFAPGALA